MVEPSKGVGFKQEPRTAARFFHLFIL